MTVSFLSCALSGLSPSRVQVEVDLANGLPICQIVGLPDSSVQEARERIRSAIKNSGFDFPLKRITINLAPAAVKKEGSAFDLAMALGILKASGQVQDLEPNLLIVGELGLNGSVRPVRGILAMVPLGLGSQGMKLVIPRDNEREAAVFPEVRFFSVASLCEAVEVMAGSREPVKQHRAWTPDESWPLDFKEVEGQELAKRAMEIAAAGGHNLLLVGPPGSGKTMLAERLPGILPPCTFDESLEISKIWSVAGLLAPEEGLARRRPFRTPHSSTSYSGMVGGGNPLRPGELSLAHRGVLFMDELPEFHRNILEALRQPLEQRQVTVVRLSGSITYPADFLFAAAMNPCPCGYYGDSYRACACSPSERIQYRKRISGPLLDRIDLHVEMGRIARGKFPEHSSGQNSQEIRRRVLEAMKIQKTRFGNRPISNSHMDPALLERHCALGSPARDLLADAYEKFHFSARGHGKILKIARTIADLSGSHAIERPHLAEALQHRTLDRTDRW